MIDFTDLWTNPATIGLLALALVGFINKVLDKEGITAPWWFPLVFTLTLTLVINYAASVLSPDSMSDVTSALNLIAATFTATGYSVYSAKKEKQEDIPVARGSLKEEHNDIWRTWGPY